MNSQTLLQRNIIHTIVVKIQSISQKNVFVIGFGKKIASFPVQISHQDRP